MWPPRATGSTVTGLVKLTGQRMMQSGGEAAKLKSMIDSLLVETIDGLKLLPECYHVASLHKGRRHSSIVCGMRCGFVNALPRSQSSSHELPLQDQLRADKAGRRTSNTPSIRSVQSPLSGFHEVARHRQPVPLATRTHPLPPPSPPITALPRSAPGPVHITTRRSTTPRPCRATWCRKRPHPEVFSPCLPFPPLGLVMRQPTLPLLQTSS
jgi:hypothetical protein